MNIKLIMAIVGGIALIVLLRFFDVPTAIHTLLEAIPRLGPLGPILFVLAYIAACVLFVPASILTLGAGALFGVFWGTVYVSIASIAGATAAFLIGRYLARDWVTQWTQGNPKFTAVSAAVTQEGWKIVGLIRLSPLFPFNLLNYGFGITNVSLRDYFFASWIGMLPGTILYVYIGSLAGTVVQLGTGKQPKTGVEWISYGVGLIATIAVTVYVTRIAKKALEKATRIGS